MKARSVILVVFVSLVLDLLAFTIPLPLFPRIIEWYASREAISSSADQTHTILSSVLAGLRSFRATLVSYRSDGQPVVTNVHKKWDIILLGGFLGSIFSFCQYLVAPHIGGLSDKYGRKRVLLISMIGNLASAGIWFQSTTFASYLLSRLVGGLSEGNVQLSIAIIADVTPASTRSRALALVGLAFSVCFTFGPALGAYFASLPLPLSVSSDTSLLNRLNVYSYAAAITLVLITIETAFLAWKLPETRGWRLSPEEESSNTAKGAGREEERQVAMNVKERKRMVDELSALHRIFLFFFSGAEFTLTFLAYDLFGATNAQNGRLLGFIGVLSSLLQGGYTRRPSVSRYPLILAHRGILSTSLGLLLLSLLPLSASSSGNESIPGKFSALILWSGAACLAFTSASVVTGLTGFVSLLCDQDEDQHVGSVEKRVEVEGKQKDKGEGEKLRKGKTLGGFRSAGQLGRALGPIFACTTYWVLGPSFCYALSGSALAFVAFKARALIRREQDRSSEIEVGTEKSKIE
ncbi:Permease of the major facilitator superfamily [Phaffia rhodozyma]|uniref:Permease of the major facilitator superfamily n=1 Tax=Phaffia rhodozyma TaxID=264483 RepID=A0A0F7SMV1_PHARH|nr:Permease of the major facilitator superfamily [Phaffia rhodozyma]